MTNKRQVVGRPTQYRRVMPDKIGETRNWYQVGGIGWLYGLSEMRQSARLFKIQFCYW